MIKGGGNKTAKKGWDVKFDILPHKDNIIENISRGKLMVLAPGEDEESFTRASKAEELACIENEEEEKKKKTSLMLKSQREFAALGKETLKSSKKFTMRYGVLPEESIDWDILGDTEHHHDMEFQPPTSARVVTSNFDFEVPIQNNFFENVFPSIGHMHVLSINFCQIHVPHFIQLLWQATSSFMIQMMMTLTGR